MEGLEDVTRKVRFSTVLVVGGSAELLHHAGTAGVAIGAVVWAVSPEAAIAAAPRNEVLAIVLGQGVPSTASEAIRERAARAGAAVIELGGEEPDDHVRLETYLRAVHGRHASRGAARSARGEATFSLLG